MFAPISLHLEAQTWMELTQYLLIARKWGWLVLLVAFVGGSISFALNSVQTPVYRASSVVRIGNAIESPDPSSGQLSIPQQLAGEYIQLLRSSRVQDATLENLGINVNLDRVISTRILPETSLLEISVTYSDPIVAADIANELANQLVEQSPSDLTNSQIVQLQIANQQIEDLTQDIIQLRERQDQITERLARVSNDILIEELNAQRARIIDQINSASANIATYQANIASYEQRTNSISVFETADIPQGPIGGGTLSNVLTVAVASGVLVLGAVILVEYVNDTVQTAEQATQVTNLPVLGVISKIGRRRNRNQRDYKSRLIINQSQTTQIIEEYRTLRANLSFNMNGDATKTRVFLISSGLPQEGKSLTAANLSMAMAMAGSRVLVIDADLRRPKQHEIFDIDEKTGLTTMLSTQPSLDDTSGALPQVAINQIRELMKPVAGLDRLWVMPSGFIPRNPNEILGSTLMRYWIDVLREIPDIDTIIIDSPPCLAISDAPVLASNIDAKVLLILEANRSKRRAAIRSKERFENADAEILGVILNGADARFEDYYGYGYSGGYYYKTLSENSDNKAIPLPETNPN